MEPIKDLSDEEFAELAAKHGGASSLGKVSSVLGCVVLRKPAKGEYARFKSQVRAGNGDAGIEHLVRLCVVHPSKELFDQMVEDRPGILDLCSSTISALSGQLTADVAKKLLTS